MKPVLQKKLTSLVERYRELATILSDHTVADDMNRYRDLSKEYAQLEPVVTGFERFQLYCNEIEDIKTLLEDSDSEMQRLAKQELKEAEERKEKAEHELQLFLLPTDPLDDNNIFLEIRAGTGGDEAAIFAGDLCRMYTRYAEAQRWKVEVINESLGEHGGYRKSFCELLVRVPTRALNLNPVSIACSVFRIRKRKGVFIPRLVPLQFCRSWMRLTI